MDGSISDHIQKRAACRLGASPQFSNADRGSKDRRTTTSTAEPTQAARSEANSTPSLTKGAAGRGVRGPAKSIDFVWAIIVLGATGYVTLARTGEQWMLAT